MQWVIKTSCHHRRPDGFHNVNTAIDEARTLKKKKYFSYHFR